MRRLPLRGPVARRLRLSFAAAALAALAATFATPAAAVDCPVNVLDAYNKAKLRGWSFSCDLSYATQAGMTYAFVTYPPAAIGCTFKTPHVLGLNHGLGRARFFGSSAAPGGRPDLKNGWKVKSYEVSGGQWQPTNGAPASVRVAWSTTEKPKPNHTYNFKLDKLVLTHASSTCAKALDEAF